MQKKNMARKVHFHPDSAVTQIRPTCPTSLETARTRDNNWKLFVLDSKIQNQANS